MVERSAKTMAHAMAVLRVVQTDAMTAALWDRSTAESWVAQSAAQMEARTVPSSVVYWAATKARSTAA